MNGYLLGCHGPVIIQRKCPWLCIQGGEGMQTIRRKKAAGKKVHCFALRITTLQAQITDSIQLPNNLVS